MDTFTIFTSVISTILCAIITGLFARMRLEFKNFTHEHKTLLESQRNQLKYTIVLAYNRAMERGYITNIELDCVNRMADSYFALGGNNYVHALIGRINNMKLQSIDIKLTK